VIKILILRTLVIRWRRKDNNQINFSISHTKIPSDQILGNLEVAFKNLFQSEDEKKFLPMDIKNIKIKTTMGTPIKIYSKTNVDFTAFIEKYEEERKRIQEEKEREEKENKQEPEDS